MLKYQLSNTTRRYRYTEQGVAHDVTLRQIIALRNIGAVRAGSAGGWVESEDNLSQQGSCWISDQNSVVFAAARIQGDALVSGPCVISHRALVEHHARVENSTVSHGAQISDMASVRDALINGECRIGGSARILNGSQILAARGMTADDRQILQIYDNATVARSTVAHQSQIYGNAIVNYAFIEHRAAIYGQAILEGNDISNVWVCDCARVYGHARLIAGRGEAQIPTLRYSSEVCDNAVIQGDCLLKHRVRVCQNAVLLGGPILLDNHVVIGASARITGNVLIEDHVQVTDSARIEGFTDDRVHIFGNKTIAGVQHITRTPYYGVY
ncbi:YdcK family protein [Entomohabitans teleogrylli]|uniref:YdcK family protein n=1 Tax=Entomohabitans teleogrylli TaxID=1384589 RepID=UPI00073DB48A|nr:YdcK family protein [Entomohabitans teleogrylli]